MVDKVIFRTIGVIRTPYRSGAPYQAVEDAPGDFRVEVAPEYSAGLKRIERFRYIYLLYYLDRVAEDRCPVEVWPPWSHGASVGVFASRAPERPNPIGLSVVKILGVEGNIVRTGGIDVFDRTPLLDIKPYIADLDSKPQAGCGWLEDEGGREHLLAHIRGIPHDHHATS